MIAERATEIARSGPRTCGNSSGESLSAGISRASRRRRAAVARPRLGRKPLRSARKMSTTASPQQLWSRPSRLRFARELTRPPLTFARGSGYVQMTTLSAPTDVQSDKGREIGTSHPADASLRRDDRGARQFAKSLLSRRRLVPQALFCRLSRACRGSGRGLASFVALRSFLRRRPALCHLRSLCWRPLRKQLRMVSENPRRTAGRTGAERPGAAHPCWTRRIRERTRSGDRTCGAS